MKGLKAPRHKRLSLEDILWSKDQIDELFIPGDDGRGLRIIKDNKLESFLSKEYFKRINRLTNDATRN